MNPSAILFEDEHLLAIHKPCGLNTHSPAPYAGEGLYDWLRHREPHWEKLAIVHRLDKDTSGVLLFGKTALANRSLTEQFTARQVEKRYVLWSDRIPPRPQLTVTSHLVRVGERYRSRPAVAGGAQAETRFRVLSTEQNRCVVEAIPLTGRTHQIRVHAADQGFPVLGDRLYDGTPAARLHLHAAQLRLAHPATGQPVTFEAPVDFELEPGVGLRELILDPAATNACRWIHGASDAWPGWHVDRLGPYFLSQSEAAPSPDQLQSLLRWTARTGGRGAYHKTLLRRIRGKSASEASPGLLFGTPAQTVFAVRENGLTFELSFEEGYSTGLFLDQRDNRRRLLTGHVGAGFRLAQPESRLEILNAFAYTCGFSVAAASAGHHVTSVDLSKKYLDWGKRNFRANALDPEKHDFIFGDVFDWFRRFKKKGRAFEVVLLDPPTFSQSREHGVFQADRDYGALVEAALPLLRPGGGILFASTNSARLAPEDFVSAIRAEILRAGRAVEQELYVPQPIDFPITREEPGHLKTIWLRTG